jgi:hypothetical protein
MALNVLLRENSRATDFTCVLAIAFGWCFVADCSGQKIESQSVVEKREFSGRNLPNNVHIQWTTTDIRPASQRSDLVAMAKKSGEKPFEGTVVLKKEHELIKAGNNIRYEFIGDAPSLNMAEGRFNTRRTWVYVPSTGQTRTLDLANKLRSNPQGSIWKGMTIAPQIEPGLGPLLQWLHSQPEAATIENSKFIRPGPMEYHKENDEWVSEWLSPSGTPLAKDADRSSLRATSRMKFQRLGEYDVPSQWQYQSGAGNKTQVVVTATVKKVDFPSRVDSSVFKLPFPIGTVFVDHSVHPNMNCVVGTDGIIRGTTDEDAFFRHSYEELVSSTASIPILSKSTWRLDYLGGAIAGLGVLIALLVWRSHAKSS